MKVKGLQVLDGYLLGDSPASCSGYGFVPLQFWNRLKHAVVAARLVDEFKAEEAQSRAAEDKGESERRLFVRWVGRLGVSVPPGHYAGTMLWPWERGWTPEAVDSYLTTRLEVAP